MKIRTKQKEYSALHKKERHVYYINNKIKILKGMQKRYKQIRTKKLAYQKRYVKNHPEMAKLHGIRQHVKRSKRIVKWGQKGIKQFYHNCPKGLEIDHFIPLLGNLVSGLHVSWNLQYLIPEVNRRKGNKVNLMEASIWYGKILVEAGLK